MQAPKTGSRESLMEFKLSYKQLIQVRWVLILSNQELFEENNVTLIHLMNFLPFNCIFWTFFFMSLKDGILYLFVFVSWFVICDLWFVSLISSKYFHQCLNTNSFHWRDLFVWLCCSYLKTWFWMIKVYLITAKSELKKLNRIDVVIFENYKFGKNSKNEVKSKLTLIEDFMYFHGIDNI